MASTETALTPRVERAAGRIPSQAYATTRAHLVQFTHRQQEAVRRAPPPRTPPSIPLPLPWSARGKTPRVRLLSDLDRQVRRAKSPGGFLRHFKSPLRVSTESLSSVCSAPSPGTAALMDGTVHVCSLSVPLSRQPSLPSLFNGFSFSDENLQSLLRQPTDLSSFAKNAALHSIAEASTTAAAAAADADGAGQLPDPTVSFCKSLPLAPFQQHLSSLSKTAPVAASSTSGFFMTEGQKPDTALPPVSRQVTSLQSSRSVTALPGPRSSGGVPVPRSQQGARPQGFESRGNCSRPSTRNLARLGRPIAQWTHIPDPEELAEAVQTQKEAAAAVDIQRIFRGYVARNVYRKLLREERRNMEDKQRAAMEIQRAYRNHVRRKRVIENRPYNPQMVEWANNYRLNLVTREGERQVKLDYRSEELANNLSTANSKLSVIGPHVNIYEIYHPKKTGPTKKELNTSAIVIQRHVRGWLVRRRFEKLQRKAAWYGSTFPKMVKEYKTLLVKIQRQHGVEQPKTPFSTKDMNDYIDIRRRYESVFDKKSFGGELEMGDIDSYFKECDLYPSKAEVAKSMEVVFGKSVAMVRQARGLKKQDLLDMVFYIYTPKATGLQDTRHSTWLNPIIDGVEARRLLGSEFVEDAPLEVCAQLVISCMRERHEKDRAVERARKEKEAAELRERLGIPHPKDSDDEEEDRVRKRMRKMRKVTLTEPGSKGDSRRSSVQNKLEERRESKETNKLGERRESKETNKLGERRESKETNKLGERRGSKEKSKLEEKQSTKEGKAAS